jgi:hypothetical protein
MHNSSCLSISFAPPNDESCTHRNILSNTNDFYSSDCDEGCHRIAIIHPSRGTRPTPHMVQGIRIVCTGTAGRVIRELEAIATSDVYRREALLNHDESRIEPVESFVAVVNKRHDVSL